MPLARAITEAEIQAYEDTGVVHLKGLIDMDWVEHLRDRMEHAMRNLGKLSHNLSHDDPNGKFVSETFLWHQHAGFRDFTRFDYEPGDCTVHHGLLLHMAGGNRSQTTRRRAYATRWAGDNVVYDPRPNIQQMLWEPTVAPGEPLDSDLWSVIRQEPVTAE